MQNKQLIVPESAWETIATAVVLIATGSILLAGDYVGVLSLDNVRNFWPLALIAIGVIDLRNSGPRQD